MTDQVKLKCTFGTETVLSPELDLYTCSYGQFHAKAYPHDIILNLNGPGVISYNIDNHIYPSDTKTKCYWDRVKLNLWLNGVYLTTLSKSYTTKTNNANS